MHHKPGTVRIIAGVWRGRVIPVPKTVELRPTTDRIRETLFNWLTFQLPGANCLDICSGSGILAFESLSRGAQHVTLVDYDSDVIRHLKQQSEKLATTHVDIIYADILQWLSQPAIRQFNIVYIDPPFSSDLWEPICERLLENNWLAPHALIYLEMPSKKTLSLPSEFKPLKQKSTSNVKYELWEFTSLSSL